MKLGAGGMPSTEQKEVYHATHGCQAASLSLTAAHWRGLKQVGSVEGKKTGGFASQEMPCLGSAASMSLSGRRKDRGIIAGVSVPHAIENAQPDVGERPQRDRMTLAFRPLALVVVVGPGFLLSTSAGQLIERVAQRLEASVATMSLAIVPALVEDGGRPCQCSKLGTPRVTSGDTTRIRTKMGHLLAVFLSSTLLAYLRMSVLLFQKCDSLTFSVHHLRGAQPSCTCALLSSPHLERQPEDASFASSSAQSGQVSGQNRDRAS